MKQFSMPFAVLRHDFIGKAIIVLLILSSQPSLTASAALPQKSGLLNESQSEPTPGAGQEAAAASARATKATAETGKAIAGATGSGIVADQSQVQALPQPSQSALSRRRVGVDENTIESFSLQQIIVLALQKNLELELSRESVEMARNNLFALRGVYDRTFSIDMNYHNQTYPVSSIFSGGGDSSALNDTTTVYNISLGQAVERTGGSWQVYFNNNYFTTTSTASTLTTQFNPSMSLSYVQPLMRNFAIDPNRRAIQIARRQLDLSDSQFRQRVIEIINQVQRAYWDLTLAIRTEQISRDAVELTKIQLENNRTLIEAGAIAPIEIRSTQAALESRKGDALIALQNITVTENVLKLLVTNDPNDKLWNAQIIPTDEPSLGESSLNLAEATQLAFQNRTELEQIRLLMQQKEVETKYLKNQLKPQLDLIGTYSSVGLAGKPSEIVEEFGLSQNTLGIIDNLNDVRERLGLRGFRPQIPPPTTLGASTPERFRGGIAQSLLNLFSQQYRTLEFGVRLTLPLGNRLAEGNLGSALAETRQLDVRQRQLMQAIQTEVRNGLQALETARQRFEAARENRSASQAQLRGEEERFQAGLSTNFFVLQRQTDLAVARSTEARALMDYNKALADLERVTGTTLVKHNVQMVAPEEIRNSYRSSYGAAKAISIGNSH